MNASLYYYKGFTLRDPKVFPRFSAWFDAMECREVYRGTQSDFHTHVHDLPPQMGGCYENGSKAQQVGTGHQLRCIPLYPAASPMGRLIRIKRDFALSLSFSLFLSFSLSLSLSLSHAHESWLCVSALPLVLTPRAHKAQLTLVGGE